MSSRGRVAPFARALLSVAVAEGDPAQAATDLKNVQAVLEAQPALAAILRNPGVPVSARRRAIAAVCDRIGVQPIVRNLVAHLVVEGHVGWLGALVTQYEARLRAHQQVLEAKVTTAVPLTPERATALQASLAAATRRAVTMSFDVDAGILGGVVARVGSTVYDGSVRGHLERVRQQLKAAGAVR